MDGDDSKVLSHVIQLAPYSFVAMNVLEKNNQKSAPPPCLIKYQDYKVQLGVDKETLFKGLEYNAGKGFVCIDKEQLATQKGIFSEMMS